MLDIWGQHADPKMELPPMPLTDRAIKNAKPGDKTRKLFDSGSTESATR